MDVVSQLYIEDVKENAKATIRQRIEEISVSLSGMFDMIVPENKEQEAEDYIRDHLLTLGAIAKSKSWSGAETPGMFRVWGLSSGPGGNVVFTSGRGSSKERLYCN